MDNKIYLTRVSKKDINDICDNIFINLYNKEYLAILDYCNNIDIEYNTNRLYNYDIIKSYQYKDYNILVFTFKEYTIVIREDSINKTVGIDTYYKAGSNIPKYTNFKIDMKNINKQL